MQKADIDYSNTLFYKIFCKDVSIADLYIGHTTNFVQRKSAHKQSCNNPKSANHNFKLYTVIREHGGWANWQMDIIAHHHCKDHHEARTKEQEYFISYNATLNSIEPMPRPKCEKQLLVPLNPIDIRSKQLCKNYNFECKNCNYNTTRNSQYNRHLLTAKHIRLTNAYETSKLHVITYKCLCGNEYKHASSLCKHKRTCKELVTEKIDTTNNAGILYSSKDNHIAELLKQNQEFKEIMIEQNKHMMELIKTRAT